VLSMLLLAAGVSSADCTALAKQLLHSMFLGRYALSFHKFNSQSSPGLAVYWRCCNCDVVACADSCRLSAQLPLSQARHRHWVDRLQLHPRGGYQLRDKDHASSCWVRCCPAHPRASRSQTKSRTARSRRGGLQQAPRLLRPAAHHAFSLHFLHSQGVHQTRKRTLAQKRLRAVAAARHSSSHPL
jgi:hypothetical protein